MNKTMNEETGGDDVKQSDWINVERAFPKHMQEIKVFIDNPHFGAFERADNAVFLNFGDPSFYDAEEQIQLMYVTKWKPIKK
jgi:hypothetical protein